MIKIANNLQHLVKQANNPNFPIFRNFDSTKPISAPIESPPDDLKFRSNPHSQAGAYWYGMNENDMLAAQAMRMTPEQYRFNQDAKQRTDQTRQNDFAARAMGMSPAQQYQHERVKERMHEREQRVQQGGTPIQAYNGVPQKDQIAAQAMGMTPEQYRFNQAAQQRKAEPLPARDYDPSRHERPYNTSNEYN